MDLSFHIDSLSSESYSEVFASLGEIPGPDHRIEELELFEIPRCRESMTQITNFLKNNPKICLGINIRLGDLPISSNSLEILSQIEETQTYFNVDISMNSLLNVKEFVSSVSAVLSRTPRFSFFVNKRDVNDIPLINLEIEEKFTTLSNKEFEILIRHIEVKNYTELVADLQFWKNFFEELGRSTGYQNFLVSLGERNRNLFSRARVRVGENGTFVIPTLYEPLSLDFKSLELENLSISSIVGKINSLMMSQFEVADLMPCKTCRNLNICTDRNVLSVLNDIKLKDCPFSSKLVEFLEQL